MEYFNIEKLFDYSKVVNQKYNTNSEAKTIYNDTRKKLEYLGEELGRRSNVKVIPNHSERPDKRAGRGKPTVHREYILTGVVPEKLKQQENIFIKLCFAGFGNGNIIFIIDVDINFKDINNPYYNDRDNIQKDTSWSIPVDNSFPKNWDELINILLPVFEERINYIESFIYSKERSQKMRNFINLLISNKNLILTGAPGTGKTYLAKQIAKEITGVKKEKSEQIGFVQFHPSYDYTDFVEGLRPVKKGKNELGFERKDGIFKAFCKTAKKEQDVNNDNAKKYVFIIDEINRAEISKVFGELFFSIDPGYRGVKGKVQTQYANLIEEGDPFKEGFYVPENVYIIGTMNDIDRSVESFDFAMRRRFAWREIKASDRMSMIVEEFKKDEKLNNENLITEAKDRLIRLNNAIYNEADKQGIEGLNSSYHIGPAYFLKLKSYAGDDKPFDKLWEYHLEGLLREYLRGLPDVEGNIKVLKNAYNNVSNDNE